MTFKTYIGTKKILATPMNRKEYNDYRGWEVPEDENPDDEGYLVEYVDGGKSNHPDHAGYISWSPKDVFERAYRPWSDSHMVQLPNTVFPSDERTVAVALDNDYGDELSGGAHQYELVNSVGFKDGKAEYVESKQAIQFVQKNEDGTMIPGLQSEQLLFALVDRHKKLNAKFPSREGALAITKMEEALHWLQARVQERINRGVMGALKK